MRTFALSSSPTVTTPLDVAVMLDPDTDSDDAVSAVCTTTPSVGLPATVTFETASALPVPPFHDTPAVLAVNFESVTVIVALENRLAKNTP
jgi:hypothetical protein